jgi:asparagine synthase (glutamine-hydrolysing)
MGAWLKSDLRPLREALLSRTSVESRGLFRYEAVRALCAAHDSNREDYSDLLLVLVNLELWCRLFLDGRTASDLADEMHELARAA